MDIGNTRAIRISAPPVRPENGVRIPGTVSKRCSGISGRTMRNWRTMPDIRLRTRSSTSAERKPLNGSSRTPRKNTRCHVRLCQSMRKRDKYVWAAIFNLTWYCISVLALSGFGKLYRIASRSCGARHGLQSWHCWLGSKLKERTTKKCNCNSMTRSTTF